jgi:cytochrome c-type biogenesis protein CcmE
MNEYVIEVDDKRLQVTATGMVEAISIARSHNQKRQTYKVTDTKAGRTVTGIPRD